MNLRSVSCTSDCKLAAEALCAIDPGTELQTQTVGECTATFVWEIGNNVPTLEQCTSAFTYINDAGKPGDKGCGGTFGGALGWDENGKRTRDPIYAIQPKTGNPNCFMPPGKHEDGTRPLDRDELPDGTKLPGIGESCPVSISRRKLNGDVACIFGGIGTGIGCTAVCLALGTM